MMNPFLIVLPTVTGLALVVGGWLVWQLLRQNGRILLRLDELEKRLNELEFGEGEEPAGLPLESEAPAFELPDLAGERKALAGFRGQPLLLMFFNPECGFCREMLPKLAPLPPHPVLLQALRSSGRESAPSKSPTSPSRLTSAATIQEGDEQHHPRLLIITTGDAEANRQLFAEHQVGCPVLLQNDGEVAKAYQAHGTPSGYLVSPVGRIASSLAMGADALLALASQPASLTPTLSPSAGERETTGGDGRADRFRQRSVTRSKIKRDGLNVGTPAPDFRLPRLDGRGELTLSELRGKRVLLVFSSPSCGPCNTLAPELERFYRAQTEREVGRVTPCAPQAEGMFQNGAHGVTRPTLPSTSIAVVMISKGEPKENRAKVKEHGLTFPVVLQQQWEISRRYAMFATPVAYLIDEAGMIAQDVAVGSDAIQDLMARAERLRAEMPAVVESQPADSWR